jgi:Ca2+-binding RTX toxin-like protein/phage tail sheath gpL-like
VAAALADAINNNGLLTDYTAMADGKTLFMVNTSAATFTPIFNITTVFGSNGAFNVPDNASASVATLLSTAVAGDIWNVNLVVGGITLSSHAYMVTAPDVAAMDTLAIIAAALADDINNNALLGFTAISEGDALVVTYQAGDSFTMTFDITPAGAYVIDETTPRTSMVDLFGAATAREIWTLTLNSQTYAVTIGATYDVNGTDILVQSMADIATVLADMIIDDVAAPSFTATVEGDTLFVTNLGGVFTTGIEITPASENTDGLYSIDDTSASTSTATLVGTPIAGEIWSIALKVDASAVATLSYTVATNDSLADVAAALADAINKDETNAADYSATALGNILLVSKRTSGGVFTTEVTLTDAGSAALAGDMTIDNATASSVVAVLTGTPAAGEVWKVAIGTDHSVTVVEGDSLADIATALAIDINDNAAADYVAIVEGDNLVITRLTAGALAPVYTIDSMVDGRLADSGDTPTTTTGLLSGVVVAGDTWTVDLGTSTHSYAAAKGDTLADIAAALAADINGDDTNAADFTATVDGDSLVIVNRVGTVFTTTFSFIHANVAVPSTNDATAYTATIIGTATAAETWRVSLVSHTANAPISSTSYTPPMATDPIGRVIYTLSGTVTTGDAWHVLLNIAQNTFVYSVVIGDSVDLGSGPVVIDTLGEIAQALALAINDDTITSGFDAVASGNDLTVTNGSLTFDVDIKTTLKAQVDLLDYPVQTGDSLSDIAAGLAMAINADDTNSADYTATNDGNSLVIVNRAGDAFTPTFSTTSVSAYEVTRDAITASSATVSAMPVEKQVFTVVLNTEDSASSHSYTVGSGDTLDDVLKALAADINTNASFAFSAVVDGSDLVVVNTIGTSFDMVNSAVAGTSTTTTMIALDGGMPFVDAVAGEVWSVIVDDGTKAAIYSHTVTEGQSQADIAAALAELFNSSATNFSAMNEGDTLIIVNRAGDAFTTGARVTAKGAITIIETDKIKQPIGGNSYFFRPVNLNTRVDEAEQVDVLTVFHGNSPANDEAVLTESSLNGLGMGGDTVIAGRVIDGGITYRNLEVLNIELGSGNDSVVIESTHTGVTNLDTGDGTDNVTVKTIAGHTNISTGLDVDRITVSNDQVLADQIAGLLTVNGGGQSLQTLSDIAWQLAYAINNDAAASDYKATTVGNTLIIFNKDGTTFTATVEVTPVSGSASTLVTDNGVTNSLTLTGTPARDDLWTITLDDTSTVLSYSNLVTGDALFVDDSGDITDNEATVTDTTITGLNMPTVSEVQNIFVQAAAGTYKLSIDDNSVNTSTAASTLATLTGTPVINDIWTLVLTIGEVDHKFSYTVLGEETLADIAAGLAVAANINELGFTVVAEGDTLVIVNTQGTNFSAGFEIYSQSGSLEDIGITGSEDVTNSATIDASTALAVVASPVNTPVAGDIWSVQFTINSVVSQVTFEVLPSGRTITLASVMADLADAINQAGPLDITAAAEADSLVLVNRAGDSFTVAFEVNAVPISASIDTNTTVSSTVLDGAAVVGDTWTVLLDGTAYSHTVIGGESLVDVAIALALEVNTNAPSAFTAMIEDNSLIVVNRDGTIFVTTFDILELGANATTTMILIGTPVENDVWTVTLDHGDSSSHSYTVQNGDSLSVIAAALADAINTSVDPNAAAYTAMARGDNLVIVNRDGVAYTTDLDIFLGGVDLSGELAEDSSTATTVVATLSGTPVVDEIWVAELLNAAGDTVLSTHSVTVGMTGMVVNTVAELAAALAQAINDNAAPEFTATSDETVLSIVNRNGTVFTVDYRVEAGGTYSIDVTPAILSTVTLGGTAVTGEVWTVSLDDGSTVLTYSHTVTGTDTLDSIATALAAAITADAAATDYTPATLGSDLQLLNNMSNSFTTTVSVAPLGTLSVTENTGATTTLATLSGTPVSSDTWNVLLTVGVDTTRYSVTVGDTVNSVVVDTLAEIATALADAITAAGGDFLATTEGDVLIISNLAGDSFATGFELVLADVTLGVITIDETVTTTTVTLSGTPIAGDVWQLTLNDGSGDTVHSYTITGVELLADIAMALAQDINDNAAADIVATVEDDTLVISHRAGTSFDTTPVILLGGTVPAGDISTDTSTADSVSITLVGTPVTNETWTVDLDGTDMSSVVVGAMVDLGSGPVVIDALDEIAQALAIHINTNYSADYSAAVVGETLVIVKRTGSFSVDYPALTITPEGGTGGTSSVDETTAEATTVLIQGVPATGDTWVVDLNTGAVTATVIVGNSYDIGSGTTTVDTRVEIAKALAKQINDAAGTFIATTDGDRLIIVDTSGAFTTVVTATPVSSGTTAQDVTTANTTVVSLTGTPVTGENWEVNLDTGTLVASTDVGATYDFGEGDTIITSLAQIAKTLADQINDAALGYVALADGDNLVIVNTVAAFTTGFMITPSNAYVLDENQDSTRSTATLTGTPAEDDVWRISLTTNLNPQGSDGIDNDGDTLIDEADEAIQRFEFSYMVKELDALADIASGLAAAINASAPASFAATAEGNQVYIVNHDNISFTTAFSVSSGNGALDISTTITPLNIASNRLIGTPNTGEVWSVTLDPSFDNMVNGTTYMVTVGDMMDLGSGMVVIDTLDEIAKAFEIMIDGAMGQFDALASGDVLQVVNTMVGTNGTNGMDDDSDGMVDEADEGYLGFIISYNVVSTGSIGFAQSAVQSTTVSLSGTPGTGEIWQVTVDGQTHSVMVGDTVNSVEVDTLAEIATALADAIRGDDANLVTFSAAGDGAILVIVETANNTFTTTFNVVPANGYSINNTPFVHTFDLGGTPAANEVWSVTLDAATVSHTVTAGQTADDVASRLAQLIVAQAAADYTATSDGATLVIVNTSADFTSSMTIAPRISYTSDSSNEVTTVVFSGTPSEGETWQVTLGGTDFSVLVDPTDNTLDSTDDDIITLDEIAAALAASINDNASSGFIATADGATLAIVNTTAAFITSFEILPRSLAVEDTVTTLTATMVGTPINNETWYLVLAAGTDFTTYSVLLDPTDNSVDTTDDDVITLAEIAAAFAAAINGDSTDYTAVISGDDLVVVNRAGDGFTANLAKSLVDESVAGSLLVDAATATNGRVVLSGTPEAGEVWTVSIDGQDNNVVIGASYDFDGVTTVVDTLDEIARALAVEINANALPDFTASYLGDTLIIVNRSGVEFSVTETINPIQRPAGALDINNTDALTSINRLSGTVIEGVVWTIILGLGDNSSSFSYQVGASDSLADIAAALALDINTNSDIRFTAASEGELLIIVNRAGNSFTVDLETTSNGTLEFTETGTTTVDLQGTPVAGENWRILLTVGDTNPVTTTLTYTVGSGDSLSDIAAALAAQINADAATTDFTAVSDGNRLAIVNRAGDIFTTELEAQHVTRGQGYATVNLDYELSAAEVQSRLQILYGIDGIRVVESRENNNVTYRVSYIGEQAGIDYDALEWAEDRENSGLIASEGASVDVKVTTLVDGGTDNSHLNNIQTVTVNSNVDGGSFTLSFLLPDANGELVEVVSAPLAWDATALDMYKVLSPILNPNGSTIDIDPEFDRTTRDPSKPYTDNVAVTKYGNVFHITFQGEYRGLLIHDIDTTGLTTGGQAQATDSTVTLSGVTEGTYVIDENSTTNMVTLTDALTESGDTWTLTMTVGVNTVSFVYTAVGGENVSTIAAALAAQVNANAGAGFTATNEAGVLIIVNKTGASFNTQLDVTGDSASASVDPSTATSTTVDLGGKLITGEVWTVNVAGTGYSITIGGTHDIYNLATMMPVATVITTLDQVAAAVATAINADAGASNYTATSLDDVLVVTKRDGGVFNTSVAITPYGLPVAGEVWSISLDSGTPISFDYTALAEDTPQSIAAALVDLINTFGIPEYQASTNGHVVVIESVAGNIFTTDFNLTPVGGSTGSAVIEVATAVVESRKDGINYYGLETLTITFGSGNDVVNVQGTSAGTTTTLNLGEGDERIFVSNQAEENLDTRTDFAKLDGHLNDIQGTLYINAGAGRHQLMISDEAATVGDGSLGTPVLITDTAATAQARDASLLAGSDIYILGLAQGNIAYSADAVDGNFAAGITVWSGFGDDVISIDGTHFRDTNLLFKATVDLSGTPVNGEVWTVSMAGEDYSYTVVTGDSLADIVDNIVAAINGDTESGYTAVAEGSSLSITTADGSDVVATASVVALGDGAIDVVYNEKLRTVTTLSTGLGDDDITVSLDAAGDDGFFVLNTQGPYNDYISTSDNDTVDATASTLPLVIFGGQGNDMIDSGSAEDIVFGDRGQVHYYDDEGNLVAVLGNAGEGNLTDGVVRDPVKIFTVNTTENSASAITVATLTGTTTTGETWTLVLDDGTARTYSHTVSGGETLAQVAQALADEINADEQYSVSVEGNVLVIESIGGIAFSTVFDAMGILGTGDMTIDAGELLFDTSTIVGGNDTINTYNGNDIIFGGINSDTINAGEGNNIVIGDQGVIDYVIDDGDNSDIDRIFSTDPDHGGNDNITTGSGDDIIIAGEDGETVQNDQVISPANVTQTVVANGSEALGTAGDTVNAGDGNNIVFGDNGQIIAAMEDAPQFTSLPITLGLVETIEPLIGGSDDITTGIGNDIVLGGIDNDTIDASDGNNIVIGDSGLIDYTAAERATNETLGTGFASFLVGATTDDSDGSTDTSTGTTVTLGDLDASDIDLIYSTDPDYGGNDTITTGSGDDIIIGGEDGELIIDTEIAGVITQASTLVADTTNGDVINGGDGNNIVFGDNGQIQAATLDAVQYGAQPITLGLVETIEPLIGGADMIDTGIGHDIVFGGINNDTIDVSDGNNIVLGDSGYIDYVAMERDPNVAFADLNASDIDIIKTTNPADGGNDTITSGIGIDFILGGTANDDISAGDNHDLVLGDHGMIEADVELSVATNLALNTQTTDLIFTSIDTGASVGGSDTIYGEGGDDIILGQQGGDFIYGGTGEDDITGGHNVLSGADGNDYIEGGDNADVILGDNGTITRFLDMSSIWIRYPAPFTDVIRDVVRFDDIDFITGNDTIYGDSNPSPAPGTGIYRDPQPGTGTHRDIIHGQRGDDFLYGGNDDDEIYGELGTDNINGGSGNDIILGDVGYIARDYNDDLTPRVNVNGSWHKDVLLEEVGVVTGVIDMSSMALLDSDPALAQRILETDLLVLVGAYNTDGSKVINPTSGAWETQILLIDLEAPFDDIVDGGDGEDVIFGQRGADTLSGGDQNDLIFGDGAANYVPFLTDMPHIYNAIRLIGNTAPGEAPLDLAQGGSVIVTPTTLMPDELRIGAPLNFQPELVTYLPPSIERLLAFTGNTGEPPAYSAATDLPRLDGSVLRPFATVISDVVHHLDVLPGNDTINGNGGDDLIFGDNVTMYSPVLTSLSTINEARDEAWDAIRGSIHGLNHLGIDYDHMQYDLNGVVPTAHDLHLAEDTIDGGAGDDMLIGDDTYVIGSFFTGLPVAQADFVTEALAVHEYLRDLEHVALDFEFAVFEAHHLVLDVLIADALINNPAQVDHDHHDLYVGNDTIMAGSGNDMIIGDEGTLISQMVTAARLFVPSTSETYISAGTLTSAQTALAAAKATRESELAAHVAADHRTGSELHSVSDLAELVWDYQYEMFTGNDWLYGDDDNDLIIGDSAAVISPILMTGTESALSINYQLTDIAVYIDDLYAEYYDDTAAYAPYHSLGSFHGSYSERGGGFGEVKMEAGNDHIYGGNGDDMIEGDSEGIATSFQYLDRNTENTSFLRRVFITHMENVSYNYTNHYLKVNPDPMIDASILHEDEIHGDAGADIIYGMWGDDALYAGVDSDADKLIGGASQFDTFFETNIANDFWLQSGDNIPRGADEAQISSYTFYALKPWFDQFMYDIATYEDSKDPLNFDAEFDPFTGDFI